MRFSFPAPALAAAILFFPVLTTLPVETVGAAVIVNADFCPTLKDIVRDTDSFFETKKTSLEHEEAGRSDWSTTFRVEGSEYCFMPRGNLEDPDDYFLQMQCHIPVPGTTLQETYERITQIVSDCITEINQTNLWYSQTTKGLSGSYNTGVQFTLRDEGEERFSIGLEITTKVEMVFFSLRH